MAFDTLGVPSNRVVNIVKDFAKKISIRSAKNSATIEVRIWQKTSFAIWSSVAAAILARVPA